MNVNRRTQAERSSATRESLIAAATPLFAAEGFAAISTEAIVSAAGVTRGALYHQFTDKTELFAAVFERLEERLTQDIATLIADGGAHDAASALRAGAEAWLQACADPVIHRIVLIEAPAVLGWERWRAIGLRYGAGLVEAVLQAAMDDGAIRRQPVRPLAHVLIGALDEAALYSARAENPAEARDEMRMALGEILTALLRNDTHAR